MAVDAKAQADRIVRGLTRRQLIEIEACTRCGECQVWCPVHTQDPVPSVSARQKISSLRHLVSKGLEGEVLQEFLRGLYECSSCGQCHVVCPVRINTPELWEQAREALAEAGISQPEKQLKQLATIKEHDNSFGRPQAERGAWAEHAWKAGLLKKRVPLWRERSAPVLYFAGCTASFDPQMQSVAVQSARLLQEAGVDFAILGDEEPCCASKLRRMGDSSFPVEARKRVGKFTSLGIETIVVSCAGCFKGLHSDYRRLWPQAGQVIHLTQFLDSLIRGGRLRPVERVPLTVTYHDPCHLGRHNQVYEEPRRVLSSVPGITLVEMPRHGAFSSCCGMGGGLKLANEAVQHKMSGARIREAESVGADAVVTPCQTCTLGLLYGVEEISSSVNILHLNELLSRAICPDATKEKILAAFSRPEGL